MPAVWFPTQRLLFIKLQTIGLILTMTLIVTLALTSIMTLRWSKRVYSISEGGCSSDVVLN